MTPKIKLITITDENGMTYDLVPEHRTFKSMASGYYVRETFGPKTAKEFSFNGTITENESVTPEVRMNRLLRRAEQLQAQIGAGK